MTEIERLEGIITEHRSDIILFGEVIKKAEEKIEELKKDEKVEPVFPPDGHCTDVWIITGLGVSRENVTLSYKARTFYSREQAQSALEFDEARAYIIERINIANKGDNGFKLGENNYRVEITQTSSLYIDAVTIQSMEPLMYGRSSEAMAELLDCDTLKAHCKTYFGVVG